MFIGRNKEIKQLTAKFDLTKSRLVVIKGRRRVGKTRLAKEFANQIRGMRLHYFTASPPNPRMTDEQERHLFATNITREFDLPYSPPMSSWSELLYFVGDLCRDKKTLLVLDEINWMGCKCSSFLNELHNVWETSLSKKKGFMLILAGSLSTWLYPSSLKLQRC